VIENRTNIKLQIQKHGSFFLVFTKTACEIAPAKSVVKTILNFDGAWQVKFDPKNGGPNTAVPFPQLASWTEQRDQAIRFYSGTASYTKAFSWNASTNSKRVLLDLGSIANIAEVKVNGVNCGVTWTPPYQLDITKSIKSGANSVEVLVTNTWANRLIGDRDLPPEKRVTWTTANPISEKAKLLPAGLLGPVTIISEVSNP
jgi:hypothetical protein